MKRKELLSRLTLDAGQDLVDPLMRVRLGA
jgi:hypothetical protein